MSEQRAKYHLENETATEEKPQSVNITLNSEQVRGIIHCVAQQSPGLLVRETIKVLALDHLNEHDAQMILRAIIAKYPEMSRETMDNMDNVQG